MNLLRSLLAISLSAALPLAAQEFTPLLENDLQPSVVATGRLADESPLYRDGTPYQGFRFRVDAPGQDLRLELRAQDYDAYLVVITPAGDHLTNDDGLGGTDALLQIPDAAPGDYSVLANAIGSSARGAFVLRAEVSPAGAPAAPNAFDPEIAGTLALGQPQPGRLNDNSPAYQDGTPYVGYSLEVASLVVRTNLRFELRSPDYDAYLVVITPAGVHLTNDDGLGGTDALLEIPDAAPGTYQVLANAVSSGARGGFTLLAELAEPDQTLANAALGLLAQTLGGQSSTPAAPATADETSAPGQSIPLRVGQSIRGELAAGDRTLSNGEFADHYQFKVRAGETVTATLRSAAFDTYLLLSPPGGEAVQNDDAPGLEGTSQIVHTFAQAGTATVVATSYAQSETGVYELSLAGGGTPAEEPVAGPAAVRLTVGQSVGGDLAEGDAQLTSGEFIDWYEVELAPATTLTLDLRSTAFDPYLLLRGPESYQADNDDFRGSPSASFLSVQLALPGTYRIGVTSKEAGKTGRYTLFTSDRQSAVTVMHLDRGGSLEGTLSPDDTSLRTGEFADYYTFYGEAGEQVTVDLRSEEFDPYLMFLPKGGAAQLDNDDFEGDLHRSLITAALPESGFYRVAVTSATAGEAGAYRLSLAVGAATELGRREFSGALTADLPKLNNGELYRTYTFAGRPGLRARIELVPEGFDSYLILRAPSGALTQNDDAGDDRTRSLIELDLSEAGEHTVVVTSYRGGETGKFALSLDLSENVVRATERAGEGGQNVQTAASDVVTVALGGVVEGRLEASDGLTENGAFRDFYAFEGLAGQNLSVALQTDAFDGVLAVVAPSGETYENDDFEGDTKLSRVDLALPVSGRYRVVVSSYRQGMEGPYALRLRQADETRETAPLANTAGGRVYGLFIGMADYPGTSADLDDCDTDARYAFDTLVQNGHMRAEDGVVAVNNAGTLANVRRHLGDMAGRLRPGDTFVFFYSGHGGRERREAFQAFDPDGYDETLNLFDGDLYDDELAALLETIPAQQQLVILDSCFSGGFSKDLISRPGRMGLFSSPEFMTSMVPEKFKAGGYLARFFADALAGKPIPGAEGASTADDNSDGFLSAHELCYYVNEGYRSIVRRAKSGGDYISPGQNLSYQTLVFDLSLNPNTQLFRAK